jgi:tetratricopeptide (TPR) repeat protein
MVLTVAAQQQLGAVSSAGTLALPIRLENAVVSYLSYLVKMVWPANLAVFYPYPPHIPVWTVGASSLVLAAISVAAWRAARTRAFIAVGWFWYLGTLIPMIGLVQVGSHAMADRYTYVPLIGIFVMIVWGVAEISGRSPVWRRLAAALACLTIVACAVVARAQVNTWRNSETLWAHALGVTSDNFRAHAGIAEVLAAGGEIDAAIGHYREAVRLAPDSDEWQVNLGLLLVQQDRIADAASAFERALALRPVDPETHNNLGAMLARLGRVQDAIAHYRRSLELKPVYPLARRNLGLALASTGDITSALRECLEALRLSPQEGQWHYEVAVMLMSQGRTGDAIAHLRDAIRLAPQHQAAREMLSKLGG